MSDFALAGDGTQHKHIEQAAHMAYYKAPSYTDGDTTVKNVHRFLGISTPADHKAQTQLNEWVNTIRDLCILFNASPAGNSNPIDVDEVWAKLRGYMSDHAADQISLGELLKEFTAICKQRVRGKQAILDMSAVLLLFIVSECCDDKIASVGGIESWNKLSKEEQDELDAKAYDQIILRLGEDAYLDLSPEERRLVNLFIHAGCCMHKELNSCSGGNKSMTAWWSRAGLIGPIKLMNRDNSAAAASDSSTARNRALNVSGAGGVKLTSLAGAIFNHKDDKKGQQDSLQTFMLTKLGYRVPFPDTSNIRYHSHCNAASELLVHLPLYREFLELVRDKKESGSFNHMEQNVYKALHDIPTLTELAALSLYSQSICITYMKQVRGNPETSALDLGPLHDDVKSHCKKIIENPGLLLDLDATYVSGALYSKPWERPEAFYAIHSMLPTLPHLSGALVAFFEGALETWERFTSEHAADGIIAQSTAEERARAWMPTTNDPLEGACGDVRVWKRKAPNMTLATFNARKMYKQNNTDAYIEKNFGPEHHKFVIKIGRDRSNGQAEQKRLIALGQADKQVAVANKAKKTATKARNDSRQKNLEAKLAKLVPILDVSKLAEKNPAINDLLKLQLEWHRLTDSSIPPKGQVSKFNKEALKKALIEAVTRLNNGEVDFSEVRVEESGEEFDLEQVSGGEEDEEELS